MKCPHRLRVIALLALLVVAGGCGSSPSIQTWQRSVENYVSSKGGDPAVLRDVTLAGDRRGFGLLGGDDPRKSTDANGVLLGHKLVANQPWLFYLVGVVQKEKVQEIRLAALSYAEGKPTWRVSGKNAAALHAYQNYNEGVWKQQHPGATGGRDKMKPPSSYTTFPRDEDRFDLATQNQQVRAIHVQSGTAWDVKLDGKE